MERAIERRNRKEIRDEVFIRIISVRGMEDIKLKFTEFRKEINLLYSEGFQHLKVLLPFLNFSTVFSFTKKKHKFYVKKKFIPMIYFSCSHEF